MNRCIVLLIPLLACAVLPAGAYGQAASRTGPALFDVTHYVAHVEPNVAEKTVAGGVLIKFVSLTEGLREVEFDCGDLVIDSVLEGGEPREFVRRGARLAVSLARPAKAGEARLLDVKYHGAPRRGIRFFPERGVVYTVFSTSQWMPCVDAPDDRAKLLLTLTLPAGAANVANGRQVGRHALGDGRVEHEWRQDTPVPTYVFGFAAGRFREVEGRRGRVRLRYLAESYSARELRRAFRDTADMIAFFEERSGVPYADATYTQVLAPGGIDQEMSGFTVLNEGYARDVLKDERDVWLGAHELAHQWWGNMVTCRDWTHFWLNEGVATFMAAAYKERRFGRAEYLREVEKYRALYEKVRDAGHDKSLVFPDWLRPTADDRTLVYEKGAYVLHLLRGEMGERAFWAGLRLYTRRHFGKSVTTADFQKAMEEAAGRSLSDFFDRWVYLTRRGGA